jgi:hypothetical protein
MRNRKEKKWYLSFPTGFAGEGALPRKTGLGRRLRHAGGQEARGRSVQALDHVNRQPTTSSAIWAVRVLIDVFP